ncbi:MAG: hypothetical protein H7836_03550 [Magnetococcus sp. YQC-3]
MSISIIEQNGFRHIVVQEERLSSDAESQLLESMALFPALPVDVRFYALKWLSASLAEGIALALARDNRNTFCFYHSHLFVYMKRLGMAVRLLRGEGIGGGVTPLFRALVLGGSAGSLEKIRYLIERLPLGEVAVFVVQHVAEEKINLLDGLLRQWTPYRVLMPQQMTPVEPRTIYVAPPGYNMRVAHGQIYLTRDRPLNAARPSLDALFESVVWEYGAATLGILLCGWGRDGVAGAKQLLEQGGEMLILHPDDCPTGKELLEQARHEVAGARVVPLEVAASLAGAAVLGEEPPGARALEIFFCGGQSGLWLRLSKLSPGDAGEASGGYPSGHGVVRALCQPEGDPHPGGSLRAALSGTFHPCDRLFSYARAVQTAAPGNIAFPGQFFSHQNLGGGLCQWRGGLLPGHSPVGVGDL